MKRKHWTALLSLLAVFLLLRSCQSEGWVKLNFRADRAGFEQAAQQVLERGSAQGVARPAGVQEVSYWKQNGAAVEFLFGGSGFGSSTSYWGVNYVPGDRFLGFQGTSMEHSTAQGKGLLFYETEGDNRCYVERLEPCWYYFKMEF